MSSTFEAKKALIVHAHPESASFCTSQMQAARDELVRQGYEVDVIDLYENKLDPVLDRGEFEHVEEPFKPQDEHLKAIKAGTLKPRIREDIDRVLAADLLVFSFPLWWFSVPAILKGWVDRVFVTGAVFGGDYGILDEAALVGKRAVVLTTTGGPEDMYSEDGALAPIESFLFHVNEGIFRFVGYEPLKPVVTYGPAHVDDEQREKALGAVRSEFEKIDERSRA